MKLKKLRHGYDIKITGETVRTIKQVDFPQKVALKPIDFEGFKPRLLVDPGDDVKVGTPLAYNKNNEDIKLISHVSGKVVGVVRGKRRVIEIIVIETDGKQTREDLKIDTNNLTKDSIIEALLKSGLFLYLVQRPYSKIANPADTPRDVFISAMDTAPLSFTEIPNTFALPAVSEESSSEKVVVRIDAGERPSLDAAF